MNLPAVAAFNFRENAQVSKVLTLAVSIGAIVASLLIIVLVIWPKINQILDLQTDNKELVVRAQNMEDKASILASLDKNKLEEQLIAAEQLLPSDKNVFSMLRQVEVVAAQSGVLLNRVEAVAGTINDASNLPSLAGAPVEQTAPAILIPGSTDGLAPRVQIRLSVTSDYSALIRFLSSLYTFSRVVSTDTISLSAAVSESLQIRSSFTVDAYWKGLPVELGSIETPIERLTGSEEQLLQKVSQPEALQAPEIPPVAVGRNDLFTPF